MDAERWRTIERIFHGVLDAPVSRRDELLARECGDDGELRAEVERLLAIDGTEDDLVQRHRVLPERPEPPPDPLIGRVIGAYRLVSRIAAGGMGVVYRGERADGLYRQDVAVKLVRGEAPDDHALRRFDLERRTLASLNHPHIARLYDGGTTAEGTPYLVMEYVDGLPIDAWCAQERLGVEARLRLFVDVVRAVHFAHQNLVVHGDLKPPNLLVDRQGTVKLLDFGIARLMENELRGGVERTLSVARLMTPEYASPEQWRGEPLTTAADVYSLGVVLHVLLTGRKPFRATGLSAGQWENVLLEREATRPSLRVHRARLVAIDDEPTSADFAAGCGTTPARLAWALRGDLDRIVLMALRKDPARRYASALAIAEDVERHLDGRPVLAREESLGYRLWSFARRNRLAVATGTIVVIAPSVALVVSRRAEARARLAADHARIEADSFRHMAELGLGALLATEGLDASQQKDALRATVRTQAHEVRRRYAEQRHLEANLLDALGLFCLRTGASNEDAAALIDEAHRLRVAEFGDGTLEVALSLRSRAEVETRIGHGQAAVELLRQALAIHRSAEGVHTDVAAAASELADALQAEGQLEEARALHGEALELRRARLGSPALPVADSLEALAGVQLSMGQREIAEAHLEEALAIRSTLLGEDATETRRVRERLAETRRL